MENLRLNNSVTPMKKQVLGKPRTPLDVLYVDKLVTVKNESVNFWYFLYKNDPEKVVDDTNVYCINRDYWIFPTYLQNAPITDILPSEIFF